MTTPHAPEPARGDDAAQLDGVDWAALGAEHRSVALGFPELDDPGAATGPSADAAGAGSPRLSARDIADLLGRPSPTDEQVAVIEAPLEPVLVVAGAGSGKTETMAARVVWLIANGLVEPEDVLGLTFTRKAAGELSSRVQARLGQLARAQGRSTADLDLLARPTIATYNAYAASLVADQDRKSVV